MAFVFTIRVPVAGVYKSGIRINNGGGYASGTSTAMTVDDEYATAGDARDVFFVGQTVYAKDASSPSNAKKVLGVVTAVTATTVRIGGGTAFAVADNDDLYTDDAGAVSYVKAKDTGFTLGPQSSLEVSEDGRGMMLFTYYDFS